jgi:hypothetical protein
MVGYAGLVPSLPVTPLVQDDDLMRGDYCAARLHLVCDPLPNIAVRDENGGSIAMKSRPEISGLKHSTAR